MLNMREIGCVCLSCMGGPGGDYMHEFSTAVSGKNEIEKNDNTKTKRKRKYFQKR